MNDKKQYIIKASFKDCAIADRKLFCKSHCIMPISIGQNVHEGEKFIATMRLIERYFARCTILLDDSVQKYTLKMGSTESLIVLHQRAVKAGTQWLERQKEVLKGLGIEHTIMRWDDWLNKPGYAENHKKIVEFYNENPVYKQSIDNNITEFLERYTSFDIPTFFNYNEARDLCLTYLLEECSVMTLWAESGYDFEVYPSGRNKAMSATYDFFIEKKYPNILKSVSLRFKKTRLQLATV